MFRRGSPDEAPRFCRPIHFSGAQCQRGNKLRVTPDLAFDCRAYWHEYNGVPRRAAPPTTVTVTVRASGKPATPTADIGTISARYRRNEIFRRADMKPICQVAYRADIGSVHSRHRIYIGPI